LTLICPKSTLNDNDALRAFPGSYHDAFLL